MRTLEFVTFNEAGKEVPIPADDLKTASEQLKGKHGLIIQRMVAQENKTDPTDPGFVRIEAEGAMAMIYALSNMEKYRGRRVDAIEVTTPN